MTFRLLHAHHGLIGLQLHPQSAEKAQWADMALFAQEPDRGRIDRLQLLGAMRSLA